MIKLNNFTKATILIALMVALYFNVVLKLFKDCWVDPNYSHSLVIPFVIGYLVWKKRQELAKLPVEPAIGGLLLILGAFISLFAGHLGAELFLQRFSLILLVSGVLLFLAGKAYVKVLAFPLALLVFMIPLPAIIFYQITFPLQLVASTCATKCIGLIGIPSLREGNVIYLPNTSLQVAEACSGIRSLFSLISLGVIIAYFTQKSIFKGSLLVLSAIPIAIVANATRVIGTGILAYYFGAKAAEGFFHSFSGWLIFLVAFLLFVLEVKLITRVSESSTSDEKESEGVRSTAIGTPSVSNLRFCLLLPVFVVGIVSLNLASHGEPVPLRTDFHRFPYRIGDWKGSDSKLDETIVKALGVDNYLNRLYIPTKGNYPIELYIGYYKSQRQGETIHSPKNCLPGSGWSILESNVHTIRVTDGTEDKAITVNRYLVQKGARKHVVLYWYHSKGRVTASEYWGKIYLVLDAISKNRTDGALVRVAVPVIGSEEDAIRNGTTFIRTMFPELPKFIPS